MKKKKPIYLPYEEKEIFKIIPLKDGIEIPLSYFNRSKYHLTIIAIRDDEKSEMRINYHVKDESTGKKVVNNTFFLSDELIGEIESTAVNKLKEGYSQNKENLEKNKYFSGNLCCTTCAADNFLNLNFEEKEGAKEIGKFLDENYEDQELFLSHLLKFPICEDLKHNYLYSPQKDSIYIRSHLGIIQKEAYFKFINDWLKSLKEYTKMFEDFVDKGIKEYEGQFKKK